MSEQPTPIEDLPEEASADVKLDYANKLSEIIFSCLDDPSTKHGLLLIADDTTRMLSLFSINADEEDLGGLIDSASRLIHAGADVPLPHKH